MKLFVRVTSLGYYIKVLKMGIEKRVKQYKVKIVDSKSLETCDAPHDTRPDTTLSLIEPRAWE